MPSESSSDLGRSSRSSAQQDSDFRPEKKQKLYIIGSDNGLATLAGTFPSLSSSSSLLSTSSTKLTTVSNDETGGKHMEDAHATLLALKSDTTSAPLISELEEEEGGDWTWGPWGAEEDARLQDALRKVLGTTTTQLNQGHDEIQDKADNQHQFQYQKQEGEHKRRINWQLVSGLMGGTRSPKQCYGRYWNSGMILERGREGEGVNKANVPRRLGPWSTEEDRILLEEVQRQRAAAAAITTNSSIYASWPTSGQVEGGSIPSVLPCISWAQVSNLLGGSRTRKQCMVRFNSVLRFAGSTVKVSGPWKVSEDRLLVEGVRLYRGQGRKGGVAWAKVSEHMGHTRTMKQCKKRWDDAFERPSGSL